MCALVIGVIVSTCITEACIVAHDSAICDLKWEGMLMASSDDNGNICLWKVGGDFQKQIRIRGDGFVSV